MLDDLFFNWSLKGRPPGLNCRISFAQVFSYMVLLSPYLCFISFLCLDQYELGDDVSVS